MDIENLRKKAGIAKYTVGYTCWAGQLEQFAKLVSDVAKAEAAEAIRQLVAERDFNAEQCRKLTAERDEAINHAKNNELYIKQLKSQVDEIAAARSFLRDQNRLLAENHKITAERDEARMVAATGAKYIEENETLKSALRDALNGLQQEYDYQWANYKETAPWINKAITTINEVLK